jgi:acid phosphatase
MLRPSRRELLGAIPLIAGAMALPTPLLRAEVPLLRFFVVGDWGRNGHTNQDKVASLMARRAAIERPSFIASTGDNFYVLGVKGVDDPKWQTSFERVYRNELLPVPWHAVLGNHDYGGNVRAQIDYRSPEGVSDSSPRGRWNVPNFRDSGSGVTLRHGDVDFFFVDTVAWIGKEGFPFSLLGDALAAGDRELQRERLGEALSNSRAKYKFVFGHHGIYSIGPHGGHPLMMDLDRLLREHNVTAYVHGHDHCLYHVTLGGMSYVCSGGGSEVKHSYKGGADPGCVYQSFCDPAGRDAPFPFWHTYIEDAGFAVFAIYADRWEFEFVTRNPPADSTPTHFLSSPPSWLPPGRGRSST